MSVSVTSVDVYSESSQTHTLYFCVDEAAAFVYENYCFTALATIVYFYSCILFIRNFVQREVCQVRCCLCVYPPSHASPSQAPRFSDYNENDFILCFRNRACVNNK